MSARLSPTGDTSTPAGPRPGIAPYLDNPDAVVAALREGLGEGSLRLDDAPAPLSLVHADRLAGAVMDGAGVIVAANEAWRRIFARGGAQAALAKVLPHRIGRMVIVNPDPPTTTEDNRDGVLGAVRPAFRLARAGRPRNSK